MFGGDDTSTVVFKLRVISPQSRDALQRNQAHLEYIGRRSGVVLNDGMNHGLFGNILNKQADEIQNIQDMSRYVRDKTFKNTNAYRAVISFAEVDALRLGYDDKEKWKELVSRKMPDIADKIGIKVQNLEYVAAVHMEKGHPHCHILFWDKEQGVKKPYVHQSVSNQIRIDMIKHVFGDEMSELQEIKNQARKAVTQTTDGFFDEFMGTFRDMTLQQYKNAMEEIKRESSLADSKLTYSHYPASVVYELANELLKLREKIPKGGRLNMKFMPEDLKPEIHDFVLKMVESNVDCDREFKKYVNSAMELAKYYTDNPDVHENAGNKAFNDMMNRLSNVVLKAIKKLNLQEKEFNQQLRQEAYRRHMIEALYSEVFGILSRSSKAEGSKVQYAHRYGELSKQAKKEMAKKYESDTGYDWDR